MRQIGVCHREGVFWVAVVFSSHAQRMSSTHCLLSAPPCNFSRARMEALPSYASECGACVRSVPDSARSRRRQPIVSCTLLSTGRASCMQLRIGCNAHHSPVTVGRTFAALARAYRRETTGIWASAGRRWKHATPVRDSPGGGGACRSQAWATRIGHMPRSGYTTYCPFPLVTTDVAEKQSRRTYHGVPWTAARSGP